jgi:hypothetical protein
MWVQKLGGCPSFDDFLAFGTSLNNPKFGAERYVSAKAKKDPLTQSDVLDFCEFSTETHKCNGKRISIGIERSQVYFLT